MILLVDDEQRHMDVYARQLSESGYTVMYQQNVDAALKFVRENLANIELLILDIMMPPGLSFKDDDTELGLKTGIRFFDKVRELVPDLPVMMLTNVSDYQVAKTFSEKRNSWFLTKKDYLPYEVVKVVNSIIKRKEELSK
jgi:CheY-like chemotaxis protein